MVVENKTSAFQLSNSETVVKVTNSQLYQFVSPDTTVFFVLPKRQYSGRFLKKFIDTSSSYQLGQLYAAENYHGNITLGAVTGAVSFLVPMLPFVGLGTATAVTLKRAKPESQVYNVPEQYREDKMFLLGYARKRKTKNVKASWVGFGVGSVAFGVFIHWLFEYGIDH